MFRNNSWIFFQQNNRGTFRREVLFSTKASLRKLPQIQDNFSEREDLCQRSWGSLPLIGMGEELMLIVGHDFGGNSHSSGDYPGPLWHICVSHHFLHPFFLLCLLL